MPEQTAKAGNFVTGGPVQLGKGVYIRRRADDELFRLCLSGAYAYVLTPRQMGKSSLMVGTISRLRAEGVRAAMLDLNLLGVKSVTAEEWYLGLLVAVESQLQLETDAYGWWRENARLGMTQRLSLFFRDVVLKEIKEQLVIFIDEIDTTLALNFADDFYAAIRSMYQDRLETPAFRRLSFVLIGVAMPNDLVKDKRRTPFNIGQRVDLSDFNAEDARPLADLLDRPAAETEQMLGWVLDWTGGQPYLTQRLLRSVAESNKEAWTRADLDEFAAGAFRRAMTTDAHFQAIRDMMIEQKSLKARGLNAEGVLKTYREILRGQRPVTDDGQSAVKSHLKLAGVTRGVDGLLVRRNRVYNELLFDEAWVEKQLELLPVDWVRRLTRVAGAGLAAVILVAAFLAPYAWAQRNAALLNAKTAQAEKARAEEQTRIAEERSREVAKANTELKSVNAALEAARQAAEDSAENERKARQGEKAQREKAEQSAKAETAARMRAEDSKREADKQRAIAEEQRNLAVANATEAEAQRALAVTAERAAKASADEAEAARKEAEAKRKEAEAARAEAEKLREEASARRVAVQAELLLSKDNGANTDVGTLLAVHSMNQRHTLEADQALRNALKALPFSASNLSAGVVPLKQPSTAFDVAVSPDGRYLATANTDGAVRIVQQDSLKEVMSFPKKEGVTGLTFSPHGRYLAVVSANGSVEISDLAPISTVIDGGSNFRLPIQILSPRPGAHLKAVIFTDNERLVATRDDAKAVQLWDAATGDPRGAPIEFTEDVNDIAFSAGGYLAVGVSGDEDTNAYLYDTSTGEVLNGLSNAGDVMAVTFSPDGRFLATGDDKHIFRLWEVSTTNMLVEQRVPHDVSEITFTANGRYVAVASGDKVTVLEVVIGVAPTGGKEIPTPVTMLTHSTTARILPASFQKGSQGGPRTTSVAVRLITTMSHKDDVSSIAFGPDGQLLVTVSKGDGVRLWNTTDGSKPIAALNDGGPGRAVAFSSDGRALATVNGAGKALWWSLSARRESLPSFGHSPYVTAMYFDQRGERIALVGGPSVEILSDLDKDKPSSKTVLSKPGVVGMEGGYYQCTAALSTDWQRLIWSCNGEISVWDLTASGVKNRIDLIKSGGSTANNVAISPDGKLAATAEAASRGDTKAFIWDIADASGSRGRLLFSLVGHTRRVMSMAFSPDGKRLATGSEDGTLRLWDTATGSEIFTATYSGAVNAVAFSPDGQYLVAAGEDPTINILSAAKPEEIVSQVFYSDTVYAVAFSPDGNYLATAGKDRTARVWEIPKGGEVATAGDKEQAQGERKIPQGREVTRIASDSTLSAVAFSTGNAAKGSYLATAGGGVPSDNNVKNVRFWYWQPADMTREVCSRLSTRSLSLNDWREYIGPLAAGESPQPVCEGK